MRSGPKIDPTGLRMLCFGHHLFAAFINIRSGVCERLRTFPLEMLQTLMFETHPMYLAISSPELVAALRRAFMQRLEVC
jgi:hypothetical protein